MRTLRRAVTSARWWVSVLPIVFGITVTLLWPTKADVSIHTKTAYAKLYLDDDRNFEWFLEGCTISGLHSRDTTELGLASFTGTAKFLEKTFARVQCISADTIRITLHSMENNREYLYLKMADKDAGIKLTNPVALKLYTHSQALEVKRKQPAILPFRAESLSIGSEIRAERITDEAWLMEQGTVTTRIHSLWGNSINEVSRHSLEVGDRLIVKASNSSAEGFIRVMNEAHVTISLLARVRETFVHRFGGKGYQIQVSIWERISNDNSLQLLWLLIGAFAALQSLLYGKE